MTNDLCTEFTEYTDIRIPSRIYKIYRKYTEYKKDVKLFTNV